MAKPRLPRRRRLLEGIALAAAVGAAAALATAAPALGATTVNCTHTASDQAALQSAIDAGGTVTVYGSCLGTWSITHDVTIQAGASGATLDGGGATGSQVIRDYVAFGSSHSLTLQGMTVSGGARGGIEVGCLAVCGTASLSLVNSTVTGNIESASDGTGAGISAWNSTVVVSGSTISSNSTPGYGGGVFLSSASMSLSGSTVTQNTAGRGGGGIYGDLSSLDVENTTVVQNSTAGSGGGIGSACSSLLLTGSSIAHNEAAANGGGISNTSPCGGHDASLTMNQSTVSLNSAQNGNGGGLGNEGDCSIAAKASITGSTFTGNTASAGRGGAIFTSSRCSSGSASVTLTGTAVGRATAGSSPNRALYGAGIFDGDSSGPSSVALQSGSSVSGNAAGTDAGGVLQCGGASFAMDAHSTVVSNTPDNLVPKATCP